MRFDLKNKLLKTFKPDIEDAAKRWEAYWNGDMIDRPLVKAYCAKDGFVMKPESTYYKRVHGDIDEVLEDTLYNASGTFYGGEAIPYFMGSFAPDEMAVLCGGSLKWTEDKKDTNWSEPFVEDWETALPLKLQEDNPLWHRMLKYYSKAAEVFRGRILPYHPDFHTNMDLLLAVRGADKLCMDLIDCPEMIDRAMEDAKQLFKKVWDEVRKAARMDEFGYLGNGYSDIGTVCGAQCDFSCMIGTDMFRRWALPALEYETSQVDHVIYHWDGPDAIKHEKDLVNIKTIHTLSYVPSPFVRHTQHIDLFMRVQKAGKAVEVGGTIEEIMLMHKELEPAKTLYYILGDTSQAEVERLLEWLVKNT